MRYVRLHDGSVYATYEGETNLSSNAKKAEKSSNIIAREDYHPIHDIGALVGYYLPSLQMKDSSLKLNQSGVTFDLDGGIWFEDELKRIANTPSEQQVLFQFLLKKQSQDGHYTTAGILDRHKMVFKYVDPHGRAMPHKMHQLLERIMPNVKVKCFGAKQVDNSTDCGPISVDNMVKLCHDTKLFNPTDFMSHEERQDTSVRKRIVHDYMQGLRKNQKEALTRLYKTDDFFKPLSLNEAPKSRMPRFEETDTNAATASKSVGFSIDDL